MSSIAEWTPSMCDNCWDKAHPGKTAFRMRTLPLDTCCFCGQNHMSGIYVRRDPQELSCKGIHHEATT